MLHPLVRPDWIAGRADVPPPPFRCAWTGGGPDAAWVHVVGELDVDLDPVDPSVQALVHLAEAELVS